MPTPKALAYPIGANAIGGSVSQFGIVPLRESDTAATSAMLIAAPAETDITKDIIANPDY